MEKNISKPVVNEFEDSLIVAFLVLRGHQITPCKRHNGRVIFEVTGDISQDIEAFYLNQEVSVLDYSRMVKSIRSSIFNLKAIK